MKSKSIWTNYKIYAFILGIIIGTVVYNLLGMDFSFAKIHRIKGMDFLDSFLYLSMINLRFLIFVFIISFLKFKDKILAIIIFIESFLLSGFITIAIITKSTILLYETPITISKILCSLFMINENKQFFYKLVAVLILVVGIILGNIFLINF